MTPEAAYQYTHDVIEGQWPEATIATSPEWACWYARDVIKGRWSEAEEIIKSNSYFFDEYCKNTLKT